MASTAQGQQTRERLVRAAMQAFADRGYRGTSLDAVAAEAGVTRQGLLHYFPSKTDLLIAVLEQRDDDDRQFSATFAQRGQADLASSLIALLRRSAAQPELARLFAVSAAESVQPDHPAHEYFRRRYEHVRGEMAEAIRREQARGRIAGDVDVESLTVALLALLAGLNLHRLLQPDIDASSALAGILGLITEEGAAVDP
jgi:AcrR family transcriptional regulator